MMSPSADRYQNWLFNPFLYVAGLPALLIGLALQLLILGLVQLNGLRIDGLLHFGIDPWTFTQQLKLTGIALTLLIAMLWLVGKVLSSSRFRLIDLAGTQLLARWPFHGILLFACIPAVKTLLLRILTQNPKDILAQLSFAERNLLSVFSLIALVFCFWTLVLMYRSFSVSCNVKGAKALAGFVIAFLTASFLSGPIFYLFNAH